MKKSKCKITDEQRIDARMNLIERAIRVACMREAGTWFYPKNMNGVGAETDGTAYGIGGVVASACSLQKLGIITLDEHEFIQRFAFECPAGWTW